MARKHLKYKDIDKLPTSAGVYFLYQQTTLVYIGKATNLRLRVPNYIQGKSFDLVGYEETYLARARQFESELLQDYKEQHGVYPYYNRRG